MITTPKMKLYLRCENETNWHDILLMPCVGKKTTIEDILRSEINRERRDIQEYLHKVSLLCQIARGLQLNEAISSPVLNDALKSRTKGQSFSSKRLDLSKLERMIKWFRKDMIIEKPSIVENLESSQKCFQDDEFIAYQIMEKTAFDSNYYVMIFVAFLRHLKIDARLVISLTPLPLKPPADDLIRKPSTKTRDDDKKRKEKDENKGKHRQKTREKKKSLSKTTKKATRKNDGRKMISSSEDEKDSPKKSVIQQVIGQDMWVEVYLIEEERWVSVDILKGKVICDKELEVAIIKTIYTDVVLV